MAYNYRTDYQRYRQYYANLRRFYQQPVTKVSFFVLLSFMTVVFFTAFAIRPTITTIGALIRDIEDKKTVDDLLEQKLTALDTLQNAIISAEADQELIENALPQDAAIGRLLQELEFLAKQNGVVILSGRFQSITLGETTTNQNKAVEVPFTLSIGGSFIGVKEFLQQTERLDRIVAVGEIQLNSGASLLQRQGFEVLAEMEGKTFFLPLISTTPSANNISEEEQ